jgi:phosphoserine aminotransferase
MFESVKIPQELLPQDGRFGCGPSLVRPEFLEDLAKVQRSFIGTSHRQAAVKDRVGHVISLLRSYLKVPKDYKIALGNGGASLVWDMVAFSLVEKKATHFYSGEFGQKWFASSDEAPFIEARGVKAANGELPKFELFADSDVHAITWNETSTGAMMPTCPSANGSLLAVDATSAAGALEWDLNKTDFFYFSPQKAFGSEGGLWVGIFSPRAVEQVARIAKSGRHIPAMLSFQEAITNGEANQTYNTPSLTTIYLLERELEWLDKKGISTVNRESHEKYKVLADWVERRDELSFYVQNPEARSFTVSTINIIDSIPYTDLTKALRKHGVLDIDCYRKLGVNQIRISLFPNISKEDLVKLTKCIDHLMDNR